MLGAKLEKQVQSIVEKSGFDIPASKEYADRIKRKIPGEHQIDVMGWDEDFLLTVECTGKQKLGRRPLKTRISEISDELRDIRKWWRGEKGPKATVRMVLATRNIKISDKLRLRAARKGIPIWDDEILDHYKRTVKALGRWTRYEIMWSLGHRRQLGVDPIQVDGAIEMRQQDNRIYIFPITPEKLLRVAFVSRRDPIYSAGYQRIIQAQKLKEIRDYLTRERGMVPNSIILNLSRASRFKRYPGFSKNGARIGRLSIPPMPCSAWVIDGQHRLMAFSSKSLSRLAKRFSLCCVGFRGLRRDKQARLFLKVNETQKKISPGLLADLASELYATEPRGAAALVVKELGLKSPFKGLIAVRPWERKKLKLANFSDSLLRSGIIPRSEKRISKLQRQHVMKTVRRFFLSLGKELQDSKINEFMFGNNGVAVLLRILHRSQDCGGRRLTGPQLRQLMRPIRTFPWRQALKDSAYSSEGDRSKLAKRIMRRMARQCRWFTPPPKR